VSLNDGKSMTGVVRTLGNELQIGDGHGRVTVVRRDRVERLRPTARSIMPEGIAEKLGPEKMKHLLTYLLRVPPQMPDYGPDSLPSPRLKSEVDAVLAGAPDRLPAHRPLRIVLVAGPKQHGPGEHDHPAWQKAWQALLSTAENTEVTTAWEWPSDELRRSAQVIVLYQSGDWTSERAVGMDEYLASGGGLVYIHDSLDGGVRAEGLARRIGLARRPGVTRFRRGELVLDFQPAQGHPIARNFDQVRFVDENCWPLVGDPRKIHVIASIQEDNEHVPAMWTTEAIKGRVFATVLGHNAWTFDDPLFRVLILRGIAWAAQEPVDRFNAQVTPGAQIK
jgi:hypothetical protein